MLQQPTRGGIFSQLKADVSHAKLHLLPLHCVSKCKASLTKRATNSCIHNATILLPNIFMAYTTETRYKVPLKAANIFRWLEMKGKGFRGGSFILFPHLNGLICFASNKPRTSHVIGQSINASLTLQ